MRREDMAMKISKV